MQDNKDIRIAQLEDEVRLLKAQLDGRDPSAGEEPGMIPLHFLADSIPDGSLSRFVLDTKTNKLKYTYVSAKWESVMGVSAEKAMADIENVFAIIHPDDLKLFKQAVNESARTMTTLSLDFRIIKSDRIYWVKTGKQPHRDGNLIVWDGLLLDVTHRKEVEQQLELEKGRMEALSNNIPNGSLYRLIYNTKIKRMRITYVSASWEVVTGIDAEVALTNLTKVFAYIHKEDFPTFLQTINYCARTMTDLSIEIRTGKRWLHVIGRPHIEDSLIVWDGIVIDISKRKSNETKLARYREKLEFMVQERTDELTATNEVLIATNEELTTTIEELDHYKNHLEDMVEEKTMEVYEEKDRLQTLADNIPNGFLNRVRLKASVLSDPNAATEWINHLQLIYASANAELLTGLSLAECMENYSLTFAKYHQEDLIKVAPILFEHFCNRTPLNIEIRFFRSENDMRWLQMSIWFTNEGEWIVCNGLILDVTERKTMEVELAIYRENLEQLVKQRTDELTAANEELVSTNEEMRATNEELSATNEELSAINDELDQYKAHLEEMVAEKTREAVESVEERKNIEKALIESEKKQRFIFENSQDLFWIADYETGKITFIGGNGYEMYGVTNEEFLGKTFYECFEPTAQIKIAALLEEKAKEYYKTGVIQHFQIEEQQYGKDNSMVWVETFMQLAPNENGIITQIVGIDRDVSERRKTEEALADSEQKQRFVFDNMRDLYWIMDLKTSKFTFVAGAGYEMYGFTNEEIMQQELCELFDEPTKKKVDDLVNEKIKEYHKTGIIQNFQFEELQYRKDGSRIWVECTYQLVPDETGEITKLVGIDRDIDMRKRMEIELAKYREHLELLVKERTDELTSANEELIAANEELITANEELDRYKTHLEKMVEQKTAELIRAKEKAEESDKLKSAFLANMSHEIRTPLNGIVGFLQFIDSDNLSPTRREECFKAIKNSSLQLEKIIDDIIDISKIEAHQMTMCPVPVKLNPFMNELHTFFETYIQTSGKEHLKLILDDSGFIDQCFIHVDTIRLRQVFNNLIGNAIKFTEKGFIRFGYRQSAPDLLEFSVEDSGIGLAPDQREVIFESFRQAEKGNTRLYGGTGLGLAISRSLVQMMGGKIWVESVQEVGTTFYFTIPNQPAYE